MPPPSKKDVLDILDRAPFAGNVYVMMPQDRNALRNNLDTYWDRVTQHDGLVSTKRTLEAENANLNARLINCIEGGKRCDCDKLTDELEKCQNGRLGDRTKLKECQDRVWVLEKKVKRLKNKPPKVVRVKEYITRYVAQPCYKYVYLPCYNYVYLPCYNYVYLPCYNACSWGWNQCRRWW